MGCIWHEARNLAERRDGEKENESSSTDAISSRYSCVLISSRGASLSLGWLRHGVFASHETERKSERQGEKMNKDQCLFLCVPEQLRQLERLCKPALAVEKNALRERVA